MSDIIQKTELSHDQLLFLFETTLGAQLGQLSLTLINSHKHQLTEGAFALKCGLAFQQLGDYEAAKNMFEQAVDSGPESGTAHCYLGLVYLHLDNAEHAKLQFLRSIEVEPEFVGGYQNLAGLYYQEHEFSKAAEFAEQAFQRDASLVSIYITATSCALALGNKKEADIWINRAIENGVSSIELVRLAGITAHQNGRPEEALDALNHYLEVQPANYDVLNIRAHIKSELERFQDLEQDLKQLLTFEPHDEWCLEQLFLAYFHTEQWQKAQLVMADLNELAAHYKITYREKTDLINKKLSLDLVELVD